MKRVFPLRLNALALVLAASFAITGPGYVYADTTTSWNPVTWFSGTSDEANLEKARKKVEEAQRAADQALREAQKALEKASEARKQAEALQSPARKQTVTEPPQQTEAESTAFTQENQPDQAAQTEKATTENTSEGLQEAETLEPIQEVQTFRQETTQGTVSSSPASNTTTKTEPWNPLSWFKKEEASQAPTVEAEASKQETQTQETESAIKLQPLSETQTTKTSEQQDESTEQEAKAAKQQSEPADTATEAAADSGQSKGSIWNPVTWFSKPVATSAPEVAATQKQETTQPKAVTPEVKTQAALIETERGKIAIELYPDQAPITVANFIKLVNEGFYNRFNMKFHRVVPGFVVQTGDPTGTGAGGSKERIPLEAKNKLSHNAKGIVAMARGADPNSATSQFYITLTSQTTLDGKYAIFGRVISGLDVLDKIEKDDMLYGIRLVELNTITRDPETEKKKFFSSIF